MAGTSNDSTVTSVRLLNEAREHWEAYAKRNGYDNIGQCLRDILEQMAGKNSVVIELSDGAITELEYRAKRRGRDVKSYLTSLLESFADGPGISSAHEPEMPKGKRK